MSLATNLSATAARLISDYGEAAILRTVTLTDVPATGAVTSSTSDKALRAVIVRRGKEFADKAADMVAQFSQGGSRVLAGSEEVLIAAAAVTTAPKPGDVFIWGASDTSDARRRVVDFEVYRVQATDLAYALGLER